MFIAKFKCPNCTTINKQEVVFGKKITSILCAKCKIQVITLEKSSGCFVVLSSKAKNGFVMILYTKKDFKKATRNLNRKVKGKNVRFIAEAIFKCNSKDNERMKINKNKELNKSKILAKGTYYKMAPADTISILSKILRRKPELVFNEEYKVPTLPGF